ncbi:hypothetical protein [uncultured Alistipes sp.]|uniref:hypothetical protein n=1 Tax=uncultured Alistipes sp. TaxID=538949 RepID=UPI00266B4C79|nr:hypothetical protein [uncultured Alistipes sp.]
MKKIMFNDRYGLTYAVIEGRKTMTRRIVPTKTRLRRALAIIHDEPHGTEQEEYMKSARYKVGEIVAVAQKYEDVEELSYLLRDPFSETYFEEVNIGDEPGYRNKMFVKSGLMPHQIRITRIKCERLQDISDADCLKEGIRYFPEINTFYFEDIRREEGFYFDNPREAFAALIDKVSGRGTWASNPWVVAYEFELVK